MNPQELPLDAREKGVPAFAGSMALSDVPAQHWRLLDEDIPLPVAVIKQDALQHNSRWMQGFVGGAGVSIAPHGKTSMSPALFDLQMKDGAWGITVSTPHQLRVALSFGHRHIFYANQLVGRQAIEYVFDALQRDAALHFYCLVDSLDNAQALAAAARRLQVSRPLNLLVELGYEGGRTGCRTREEALALARYVAAQDGLVLSGIEGFEGLLRGADTAGTTRLVTAFLDDLTTLARQCDEAKLFDGGVILSAGGSSYFDLVAQALKSVALSVPATVLLRSGCYITHDDAMYVRAFDALRQRSPALAATGGGLRPALEVWAYVQSRPEPGRVIVGLGKRDVSHDELPVLLSWFRPGGSMPAPQPAPGGHTVVRLNDQHGHMTVPPESPLKVGDMVAFGISHPCLTFDKWRVIHLVDDDYQVVSSLRTYF